MRVYLIPLLILLTAGELYQIPVIVLDGEGGRVLECQRGDDCYIEEPADPWTKLPLAVVSLLTIMAAFIVAPIIVYVYRRQPGSLK